MCGAKLQKKNDSNKKMTYFQQKFDYFNLFYYLCSEITLFAHHKFANSYLLIHIFVN